MTHAQILAISESVEKLYMDCTTELLINIGAHFNSGKGLATADWEIAKLSEMGALTKESVAIIARNTGKKADVVEEALASALDIDLAGLDKVLAGAVNAGAIQGAAQTWRASERVQEVMTNYLTQATDELNLVNTVMLNSTRSRYLAAIAQTVDEANRIEALLNAQNAEELAAQLSDVQKVLNQGTLQVVTSAQARTTALRNALNTLCGKGITGFIDAAGRQWSPEAYVNMDIRTTVHNTAIQGQKARSADFDVSTFQISTHGGARPLCAPWQGRICSWKRGDSGTVYDINGKGYPYISIYDTSYGQPAGIFGINCGHFPETFVSGYSTPRYEPLQTEAEKAENDRQYAESQQQRALERDVRDAKTKAYVYNAAGDKEAFDKAALEVKRRQADYKAFCVDTGRTPRLDRTQVLGYNRSTAGRVTQSVTRQTTVASRPTTTHVTKYGYAKRADVAKWQNNNDYFDELKLKDQRTGYIGTPNSYVINSDLRAGTKLSKENQATVDLLDKTIWGKEIPQDLLADRYVKEDFLKQFGVSHYTDAKNAAAALASSSGKVMVDHGYTSVSLLPDKNIFTKYPVKLKIEVPQGTHAYITGNIKESEAILKRDSSFELVSAKEVNGKLEMILRVVG